MNWQHEILDEVPQGGEFTEVFFGKDQSGDFTWIRFFNGTDAWLGVFQNGGSPDKISAYTFNHRTAVLADKTVYIIDLAIKSALLIQVSKNAFQDLIADEKSVFAADFTTIHVIENARLIKVIDGYYFDMFRFKSITPTVVLGEFFQYGGDWNDLQIDRQSLVIRGRE